MYVVLRNFVAMIPLGRVGTADRMPRISARKRHGGKASRTCENSGGGIAKGSRYAPGA